jgi:tetratricopeptide (TPR) repeat protein
MSKAQTPVSKRALQVCGAIVLLAPVIAWMAIGFDGSASPALREAESGQPTDALRSDSANRASLEGQQDPGSSRPASGEAAGSSAESRATMQAALRAAAAKDRNTDISPKVGRTLTNVIELLNAEKFAEATAALEPMLTWEALSAMTPFERSRVYQLSFNLNMHEESYEAAQADIQAAIESGGLNAEELKRMSYQSAQLFVQMEDYARAADSLELWVAQQNATPDAVPNLGAYYLLAASYYYQDKFDDARDHMETLFALPGEKQEGWYSMMAALYLKNEDYSKARPVLEKMVELYGKDRYREQLAGVNAELAGAGN